MNHKTLVGIFLLGALSICPDAMAQVNLPTSPKPVLVDANSAYVLSDNNAGEERLPVYNSESLLSVSSEYPWLRATIDDEMLVLDYDANTNSGERTCRITFARSGYNSTVMTVSQPGNALSSDLASLYNATEGMVLPTSAKASSYYPDKPIENSFDNNLNTDYHSSYSGFKPSDSSTWPILQYFFSENFDLGYINYIPVYSNYNGTFGLVDIYVSQDGGNEYTLIDTFDFGFPTAAKIVKMPAGTANNINAVKFVVRSGRHHSGGDNAFASCKEMQFFKVNNDGDLFVDDVYSALKPTVTLDDINNMQSSMLKELALKMYTGEYDSKGRVANIEPVLNTGDLNSLVRGYGQYDQYQGATGVMMGKGTYTVFVSGIPDAKGTATLTLRSWKPTFDRSENYTLRNGINIINKTSSWDGLCYLNNYNSKANVDAGNIATINIHIVNGAVNGVLHPWYTNEENQAILDNACHGMIDLIGSHVHAIWETDAVKTYSAGKYVQYMNLLDQYIIWIQRMMGIEKYELSKYGNVSLIFGCNYNYMTQTGTGIAIHVDGRSRVCGPTAMMTTDSDAVWGLTHEWGHQHQMDPYFRWSTTWEVTNNECSIYDFLRMGYYDRVESSRNNGVKFFLNDSYTTTSSTNRQKAIDLAKDETSTAFDWCPALKEFAANETNVVTKYAEDKYHALSSLEADGSYYMMLFWMLQNYFSEPMADGYRNEGDYVEDFEPDLYHSLRMTVYENGSTIGKSEIDKYELIANAQNGSNAMYKRLAEAYPESCWITKGYLNGSNNKGQNVVPFILNYVRKASFLSGYNLVPYFERWGLLRSIALYAPDYASSYYLMPRDMYDEFCEDMKVMKDRNGNTLKEVTDEFIEKISNSPIPHFQKPEIPNDHQITNDEIKSTLTE